LEVAGRVDYTRVNPGGAIHLSTESLAGLALRTITASGAPANDLGEQFAKANRKMLRRVDQL
jgi:hypothetical protein